MPFQWRDINSSSFQFLALQGREGDMEMPTRPPLPLRSKYPSTATLYTILRAISSRTNTCKVRAAKMHLCIFIAEPQCIALCAIRNSKLLKISYDWRGMPVEFIQVPQPTGVSGDTLYKMAMAYDGTGRRISKTRWVKARGDAGWSRRHATQQELNLWLEPGEVHLLFSSISEAKGMLLNGGIKMYNAAQQCIDEAFEKIEPVMQPE